ncbi:MAG TPA: thiol-disulfide isomerase, partial [Bryobacteraceae bacterium]|nr:thiol-disulfide isomerase [Bryobacteraceae bacterium]
MPLQTYEEARPWARSIRQRVATREMPPWHLDKTVGIQHFLNDRSLTDEQIATIVKWVDEGVPMGDRKDLPPAKVWPDDSGWQLAKVLGRQPDLVIQSEPWTVPAVSQDVWWKPVSDVPITEERWVQAVE